MACIVKAKAFALIELLVVIATISLISQCSATIPFTCKDDF